MGLNTSDCYSCLLKQGATARQFWRRASCTRSEWVLNGVHLPILPDFSEFLINRGKLSILIRMAKSMLFHSPPARRFPAITFARDDALPLRPPKGSVNPDSDALVFGRIERAAIGDERHHDGDRNSLARMLAHVIKDQLCQRPRAPGHS